MHIALNQSLEPTAASLSVYGCYEASAARRLRLSVVSGGCGSAGR
jgi:hypothetical protein